MKLDQGLEIKENSFRFSMLHFRNIVIPKVNDLIYRRRLLLRNSSVLRRTLVDIRDKLSNKFNDLYDFDNVSLRRDMLLLFLSKEELDSRLSFEIKNLPKDQDPVLTDTYSLILQLRKVQIKNPKVRNQDPLITSTSDVIKDRIREQFDILESYKTQTVDTSWMKYKLVEDGRKLGSIFFAKSKEDAESFLDDVESCHENRSPSLIHSLRALTFVKEDSVLHEESYVREEKEILRQIFCINSGSETEGISLLQRIELEELKSQYPTDFIPDDLLQ